MVQPAIQLLQKYKFCKMYACSNPMNSLQANALGYFESRIQFET